ncbi:hypothetical protein PYCC9005_000069 [Savitreella phatthalungensis]
MATQTVGGPIEKSIVSKLTSALQPSQLEVYNDSHLHAHHAAMRGNTSPETHFRVLAVSSRFEGQRLAQRHRTVYGLLREEMEVAGGIHALQLRLKTPQEAEAEAQTTAGKAQTCRGEH